MQVDKTREQSITLIEKELTIYKNFIPVHALAFAEFGKALAQSEEEYRIIVKIREEENSDHLLGLRTIAQRILIYVHTPEFRLKVRIRKTLAQFGDKPLVELFDHMSIRLLINEKPERS